MNGHASQHPRDAPQGRLVDHHRRRWPRHSGGRASEDQEERARSDLHRAPRRRQVRSRQLQDRGRPARRRRQRRQRAVARAGRDRSPRRLSVRDDLQAGQADRQPEEGRRGARLRHHRLLQAGSADFPEGRIRRADHPRAPRGRELPASRRQGHVRRRVHRTEGRLSAPGRPRRLPEEDRRRPEHQAGARGAVHARERERREDRVRDAVDGSDGGESPQLRQRHPDRIGRHARERTARRHRQGGPQLHRDAQPLAEGRDADRGRYSRGHDRHPVGVRPGAAVPGPDQGSPQQSRSDVGG